MLELYVHGMEVKLGIKGWTTSTRDTWDDDWCKCDVVLSMQIS